MTALSVLLFSLMTFVSQSVLVTSIHDSPAVFEPPKNYNDQSNSQNSVPYVPERSLEFHSTEKSLQMKTTTTETSPERVIEISKTTPFGIPGLSTLEMLGYKYKPTLGYYKFHLDAATWHTAKQVCESESAHLAIINSDEERDVLLDFWSKTRLDTEYDSFEPDFGTIYSIYSKVAQQRQYYIFLGFHDQNEEGKYETIFGEALKNTGFDKWSKYEPNDKYPGEDCGSLSFSSGYLNDIDCDAKLRFICEREI